jgi:hypothetical protein
MKKERVVFNSGIFKKEDLNKDYLEIKDHLYTAPTKSGAYLGIKKPDRSGEQVTTLLEIHYSNPLLFIDYWGSPQEVLQGKIGQEALWVGKDSLKLKKIKDIQIRQPKAIHFKGKSKPLKYRYIVAEVEDDSIRSPLPQEYELARTKFSEHYKKPAIPDDMDLGEKEFFYNQIEKIIQENGPIIKNMEIKPAGKLEKTLQVASFLIFISGALLVSFNLTGNIISENISKNYSFIGSCFIFASLVLVLISFKK